MFLRTIMAVAVVAFLSTPALAAHCPLDVAAIDNAMSKMSLDSDTKAQAQALRDEGLALHEAGQHKESVDKLAEAMRILLSSM